MTKEIHQDLSDEEQLEQVLQRLGDHRDHGPAAVKQEYEAERLRIRINHKNQEKATLLTEKFSDAAQKTATATFWLAIATIILAITAPEFNSQVQHTA